MKKQTTPAIVVENKIGYETLLQNYPWIIEPDKHAVLSPDSDGLLCGLFMSHFLNWKISGYYDGKMLLLKDGILARDCVFLDVDIFRQNIKSIGHHMLLFNKDRIPDSWNQYQDCIQPNNMRDYDFKNTFPLKYPLATIHLLLGIIGSTRKIDIPKSALCPLFFVDGTFQVLFTYPENVLDWIRFLGGLKQGSILHEVFCNEHYSIYDLMVAMDEFFRKRDAICAARQMGPRERGDRLVLSDRNGAPFNLVQKNHLYEIESNAKDRVEQFLNLLSGLVKWNYKTKDWAWNNMKLYKFRKGILRPGVSSYYKIMMPQNPLSFAITSRENLEYTLENPDAIS